MREHVQSWISLLGYRLLESSTLKLMTDPVTAAMIISSILPFCPRMIHQFGHGAQVRPRERTIAPLAQRCLSGIAFIDNWRLRQLGRRGPGGI